MCDQPSRENGGLCGECCPLPASATGLYKHLIWLGIFQALGGLSAAAFLLREEGDPTIQNDPMAIVGHIGNLCNFIVLVWWILVCIIVCCKIKVEEQPWFKPLKTCAIVCVSIPIAFQVLYVLCALLVVIVTFSSPDDPRALSSLRALRFLRIGPLVSLICYIVITHKVRSAALNILAKPPAV